MTTLSPSTAAAGLHLCVEVGVANASADDRWSRRADALAAWLIGEWQREQTKSTASDSASTRLDSASCPATPRQDDNGETAAR